MESPTCVNCLTKCVIVIENFLNLEGHQNPIGGSEVTVILLKGLISPVGGVALGRVFAGLFVNSP